MKLLRANIYCVEDPVLYFQHSLKLTIEQNYFELFTPEHQNH